MQLGAKNFASSKATCLHSLEWRLSCNGESRPFDSNIVPLLEVAAIVKTLHQHLWGAHDYALHCPRAAPFDGVVSCTYHHWSQMISRNRSEVGQAVLSATCI